MNEVYVTLVQSLVLIGVIAFSARLIAKSKNILLTVFFTFAMVSWLLSDLYWLTYDILRPGTRMPFAANEIGECALALLLTASLSSLRQGTRRPWPEIVCGALFMLANVVLWGIWTGEWLQDVISGVAFGVLLCYLIVLLKQESVLPRAGFAIFGVSMLLVIASQTVSTYVTSPIGKAVEYVSYVILYALVAWLIYLSVRALIKGEHVKGLILSVACLEWTTLTLYLSPGILYYCALTIDTFAAVLMCISLRKEVLADDLR